MRVPKVFIIILNWNGLSNTLECLESVFEMDYRNFEVIVVDNGSTDDSAEVITRKYSQVRVVKNKKNLGYTGGNNIGMEYALGRGADYVWLLNNDTVVEMDTLGRLVDAGMSDETVGLISPVIYYYDDRQRIQFCGSYVDWNEWSFLHSKDLDSWERIKSTVTVSLWGTALLIKSVVIERVGNLNEKYFAYEEDAEYCIRANRRGYGCVLEPRARVYHKDSGSTGSRTAPIQLFLRRRNSYFFWMSNLKGTDKLIYFKSFLGTIVWLGSLRENKLNGSRDVYLDAAWSAMRDIGGSWEERVKMPGWLRRVFYCSFWLYPYWKGMKNRFSNIFKVLKRSSDTRC